MHADHPLRWPTFARRSTVSGKWTKPFSIVAVWACRRMILSPSGSYRVTRERPASMRSWISWVPDALSSIKMVVGLKRSPCSRTARLRLGKSSFLRDVEQIEVRPLDAPSRADGIVGKLGGLVRRVPALDDLIEARWALLWAIAPKPGFLDHSAAGRRRRLLILSGEVIFTDGRSDALQRFERFALRVKRCAGHSRERTRSAV